MGVFGMFHVSPCLVILNRHRPFTRDTPENRTLPNGINVPVGVIAETCTATCDTAGFSLAGLENGQECCTHTCFLCL